MVMSERIRVAVIDDHPLFRDGVAHTLRSSELIDLVGEGSCADDALRLIKEKDSDVVLLDVNMPGGGIAAARAIAQFRQGIKIIMLTVSENEEHVTQAMDAGAHGYILKGTSGAELVAAICGVWHGEPYITPSLAARLLILARRKATQVSNTKSDPLDLTEREDQIIGHVALGLTNKEIARRLEISDKTVKHYMTNIMQKLNVRNRVEAVLVRQTKSRAGAEG
jgi:two-component system, NarL family, nitrate/nitrite response regulator NarL